MDLGKREYNMSNVDEEQSRLAFGWGTKESTETITRLPCPVIPVTGPPPQVNDIVIKQLKRHTRKRSKQHHG